MPKFAAKVDKNQPAIVAYFRAAGWIVEVMSAVGGGNPDIDISKHSVTIKVEIKDGQKSKLNARQIEWHQGWDGACCVVRSFEDAQRLNDNMNEHGAELERLMTKVMAGMEVVPLQA